MKWRFAMSSPSRQARAMSLTDLVLVAALWAGAWIAFGAVARGTVWLFCLGYGC
jgi:hypothetical protein